MKEKEQVDSYANRHIKKQTTLDNEHAKRFFQTFYSGEEPKKDLLEVDTFNRNFRLYMKALSGKEILDTVDNRKILNKVIDKNNSLDVDLKEVNDFFTNIVDVTKGTMDIKGLEIVEGKPDPNLLKATGLKEFTGHTFSSEPV